MEWTVLERPESAYIFDQQLKDKRTNILVTYETKTGKRYVKQMGLTMPENIAAALTAAGVHPVNWEELTHGG